MARWNIDGNWIRTPNGQPLHLTDAGEEVWIELLINVPAGTPPPRLFAGGGDDRVSGAQSYWVHLGAGDDTAYAAGPVFWETDRWPATVIIGGAGNDICRDGHGSADFYGGSGRDVWLSSFGGMLNQSVDGDVDRVWLGRGDDAAAYRFDVLSAPEGQVFEDRSVRLYGGAGRDTLALRQATTMESFLPEGAVLNFRQIAQGETRWHNLTFAGFEQFDIQLADQALRRVVFGDGNDAFDYLPVHAIDEPGRDGGLTILGLGGDDRVLGLYGGHGDTIFGGVGNDTITGRSAGAGAVDRLFGGDGGDDLLANGIEVSAEGRTVMYGGAGADWFYFDLAGNDARVADFQQGQDKIVLDGTRGYLLLDDDLRARCDGLRAPDHALNLWRDDAEMLSFTLSFARTEDWWQTHAFRYDRQSGVLWVQTDYSPTGGGTWQRMAQIIGAPDLGLADFRIADFL